MSTLPLGSFSSSRSCALAIADGSLGFYSQWTGLREELCLVFPLIPEGKTTQKLTGTGADTHMNTQRKAKMKEYITKYIRSVTHVDLVSCEKIIQPWKELLIYLCGIKDDLGHWFFL